jgi:hypothetical protein
LRLRPTSSDKQFKRTGVRQAGFRGFRGLQAEHGFFRWHRGDPEFGCRLPEVGVAGEKLDALKLLQPVMRRKVPRAISE